MSIRCFQKILILTMILLSFSVKSQENKNRNFFNAEKGDFYFYWGYNRATFSTSTIHFYGPNWDFSLKNVQAKDRPEKVSLAYLHPAKISIPQYCYRLGYFLSDKWSISMGIDHMKYVIKKDQFVDIGGVIGVEASDEYAGTYLNDKIQLTRDFLEYEHSDGFNFVSLDAERYFPIRPILPNKLKVTWFAGFGGIWLITKTKVEVMGYGLDNDFHLAGFSGALKTGPRFEFCNRYFLQAEWKYGYASLGDVLVHNDRPERAEQNITYHEFALSLGLKFKWKKEKAIQSP